MNGIICPSVPPIWLCSHHRIIMKFSGAITKDQGKVHAKCQGQGSKVKVIEVTTQLNRFWTVTPVWFRRHQMETLSASLALCAGNSTVTGELTSQMPVARGFDVFIDLRLKRLSKQSWGWLFETPSRSLWRHCNGKSLYYLLFLIIEDKNSFQNSIQSVPV